VKQLCLLFKVETS